MIASIVGAGVARPKDARPNLSSAGNDQRLQPKPALVMAGRLFLLGVNVDRGSVEVKDHPLGRGTRRPRPRPSPGDGPRRADPGELILADRQHQPPRRGDRRDPPEQRCLAGQRRKVRHAPAAIRQHHRQIAEHPPWHMARTALTRTLKRIAQPGRQPDPVGHPRQQRRTGPREQSRSVRPDIYRLDTLTSHHLQGEPPERGDRCLDIPNPPCSGGRFRPAGRAAIDEARLVWFQCCPRVGGNHCCGYRTCSRVWATITSVGIPPRGTRWAARTHRRRRLPRTTRHLHRHLYDDGISGCAFAPR